jgi:methylated-DNA-[protein]-cysteine S-methyltransferase
MKKMDWGFFRAPGGWCAAAWTPKGLSALVLPQKNRVEALQKLHEYLPPLSGKIWDQKAEIVPQNVQIQVRRALTGKPFKYSKFDISFLTIFQQKILKAACEIPWGQVRSYGWVARRAGWPKGSRAAGQALNRNSIPVFIPCHRVVASGNRLGGYGSGINWKIRLLKNEGVTINRGLVS